ncbi:hypothetical protein MtrunA17_Chr8g0341831 [Medicago truncatula]|uniref:Uncharacterized protein n=1 Tax=Medicago truncatula TaxID=3880 RepID=A0A396GI40_MEDTR|nr:hypothetical protein MtrunA17_Chr8g0341831 [Medicago truncatula]
MRFVFGSSRLFSVCLPGVLILLWFSYSNPGLYLQDSKIMGLLPP